LNNLVEPDDTPCLIGGDRQGKDNSTVNVDVTLEIIFRLHAAKNLSFDPCRPCRTNNWVNSLDRFLQVEDKYGVRLSLHRKRCRNGARVNSCDGRYNLVGVACQTNKQKQPTKASLFVCEFDEKKNANRRHLPETIQIICVARGLLNFKHDFVPSTLHQSALSRNLN
jgi:hypothetical protein